MSSEKDLYAILGLSPQATENQINRAYRRLAQRYHPDSGTQEASATLYKELEQAYKTLGDPIRRRAYDRKLSEKERDIKSVLVMNFQDSQEKLLALPEEQAFYLLLEIRPGGAVTSKRLPINLTLVIDCSTSMHGNRMDNVKAAAHRIIDDLEEQDTLGLITFSDRAEVLMPSQQLIDRARAHARVASLWTSGGTEILQGLKTGLGELRRFHNDNVVSHLILLTDGRTYGDEEDCITEGRRAGLERIGINALGIGEDWNDVFLDDLVHQASGVCAYISNPRHVSKVLRDQVQGLGSLFARNMKLTLNFESNIKLEAAFQASPHIEQLENQRGTLKLGSLQASVPTRVLLETVIAATPPGQHALGNLELTAEVPAIQRSERLLVEMEKEFVVEPPKGSPPLAIVNTLSRLSLFRLQQQAWQALDEGDQHKAQQRLETVATRLLDAGEKELAHMALLEAGRVAQGGRVSEKGHKTIKYGTRGLGIKF